MNPQRAHDPDADGSVLTGPVARVIHLLEVIATGAGDELGVRGLARETGIDKSAVSRLLSQLAELDMLESAGQPGRYRIGPRFFAVGAAVTSKDELWLASRPMLERLVARFNETSYLAVLERHEVVFREIVECTQSIRYVVELGRRAPLHAGSAGRAILAGLTDPEVDAVLRSPLERVTPGTITDPDELRRRVMEDRARGYTLSAGERSIGGIGIAAPFFAADGRCKGSLVITMPQTRWEPAREAEFADAIRTTARELSSRLGFRGHPSMAQDP